MQEAAFRDDPALSSLAQAFRAYTLEAAVRERQLAEAARVLETTGIPALLGKGYAAARYYPRPALRPYGDIDLFLPAALRPRALEAFRKAGSALPVDVHPGFAELSDRAGEDLFARSELIHVQGVSVRVLGREDHLRLLCLHLLRHGGTRPLWLSDVAALVEASGSSLDWDLVLSGEERSARAVACVVGLTVRLLGATVPEARALRSAGFDCPPRWLEEGLLEQWGQGSGFRLPLGDAISRPRLFLGELVRHWPNGIEASAGVGAPFGEGPRWPYQLAFVAVRAVRGLRRV